MNYLAPLARFCSSTRSLGILALFAVLVPACRVTDVPLWKPARPTQDAYVVETIRNVTYYHGPDTTSERHRLDVFLPKGRKDFPVVLLVHGGAWMMGDNRCCGLYSSVGEFLASQGIAAVLPNYRLSPGVQHPEHIKDVARALAWTKAHMAEYGGNTKELFLVGHSAGGHLVALLATDDSYLQAEKLELADIQGVVAVSGVYHLPSEAQKYTLGGLSPAAFRLRQIMGIRRESVLAALPPAEFSLLTLKVNVFGPVFGNDPEVRQAASPVNHVRPGLPPFLLISAENDLPTLPGMAEEFDQALRSKGCSSQLLRVANRNHNTIMFRAIEPRDPVGAAIVGFVQQNAGKSRERQGAGSRPTP